MSVPARRGALLVGAVIVSVASVAAPAAAQGDTDAAGYAAWTLGGSGGDYSGTMTLPGNFPASTFTSDARANSWTGSGANTWLGEDTPFGQVFGTSQDEPYVAFRPANDAPGNPSTTTYTFEEPTPDYGWGFALGDIDADTVTVSATDADGNPVPIDALRYEGSFNFCDTSPRPGACSGLSAPYHTPTWTPGQNSGVLSGDGDDETGGVGWFRPTVPLSTLTFEFEALSGFPIYQAWFAKLEIEPEPEPTEPEPPHTTEAPSAAEPVANDDTATEQPTLPTTGTSLPAILLGGLAMLAIGIAFIGLRRRREPGA